MNRKKITTHALECEQWFYLTVEEMSHSFGVSVNIIQEIIDEGIIVPEKNEADQWVFSHEAFGEVRTALKLHQDLGVNWAGAGLVLDLLKEIDWLKAQLGVESKT